MIEQTKGVNDAPDPSDGLFLRDLGTELLTTPDVADMLDAPVTRVMDLLQNHQLLSVRLDGIRYIPARFFTEDNAVNKFVPGLIALLSDGGYTDEEIIRFLFTDDPSLGERPVDALHGHSAREVMRRAQAMAL